MIFERSLLAKEREELLERRVSGRVGEQLIFSCLPKLLKEHREFVIFLRVRVLVESY